MKLRLLLSALSLAALILLGVILRAPLSVLLLLTAAVAVKHTAYVLRGGSIFQPLRNYIQQRNMRAGNIISRAVFGFFSGVFSCSLCMTTQLSIWLVAVPASYLAHKRYGHIAQNLAGGNLPISAEWFLTVLGTFMLAMAVAGVAMAVWRLSEFPAELMEQILALKKAKDYAQLNFGSSGSNRSLAAVLGDLGEAGIVDLLERVHAHCQDANYCIFALGECLNESFPRHLIATCAEFSLPGGDEGVLQRGLQSMAEQYLRQMIRAYPPETYVRIREEFASQFMEDPINFRYDWRIALAA